MICSSGIDPHDDSYTYICIEHSIQFAQNFKKRRFQFRMKTIWIISWLHQRFERVRWNWRHIIEWTKIKWRIDFEWTMKWEGKMNSYMLIKQTMFMWWVQNLKSDPSSDEFFSIIWFFRAFFLTIRTNLIKICSVEVLSKCL